MPVPNGARALTFTSVYPSSDGANLTLDTAQCQCTALYKYHHNPVHHICGFYPPLQPSNCSFKINHLYCLIQQCLPQIKSWAQIARVSCVLF